MLADYYTPFFLSRDLKEESLFCRFQNLPAELRLKIWQEALPPPRTIHLITKPNKDFVIQTSSRRRIQRATERLPHRLARRGARRDADVVNHCISTVKCPKDVSSLLHTCRESRTEALKHYQPLFSPKSSDDPSFGLHYFDPVTDGIFVNDIWPWYAAEGCCSKPTGIFNARVLSISCNSWFGEWKANSNLLFGKGGLLRFKRLEELHIVHRILTPLELEKVQMWKYGQQMGPGALTMFLRRPNDPYVIDFPGTSVCIDVKQILEKFALMKTANPTWNVPKVKLMAWATKPEFPPIFPDYLDNEDSARISAFLPR